MSLTTPIAAEGSKAFAPDIYKYDIAAVPALLLPKVANIVGSVEGDEPAVRIANLTEPAAAVVAEGGQIEMDDVTAGEVVVTTQKVATMTSASREMLAQGTIARPLVAAMSKSIADKANSLIVADLEAAATATEEFGDNLDAISNAIWAIEEAGAAADFILASPAFMAKVSALKAGTGSNEPLLGAGLAAQERRLFGLPVLVSRHVSTALIGASEATPAAVGQVHFAKSEDFLFDTDSVAMRATLRFGLTVAQPTWLYKVTDAA